MRYTCLFILLLSPCLALFSQNQDTIYSSTQFTDEARILVMDTVADSQYDSVHIFRPDPVKATWLAVIVPGLGQIYNRSYWKLPIVYGGIMGCAYAISWNGRMYKDYTEAYSDILTDKQLSTDPDRSYNAILPYGYTIESMGGRSQYTATLKERQTVFRRYRDLAIAATVAVYVLSIIDAYVDAQLYDFDISPDLSMNVQPQLYYDLQQQKYSAELKVAFKF